MVRKPKLVVVWDKPAFTSFQMAYEYIKEDSISNADQFREEILSVIKKLVDNPQKYPPDKFKKSNTGNYRAFEKYYYRIAYKITEQEIIILRVRHVRQEPKGY